MINKFITKSIFIASIVVSLLLCSFVANAQIVLLTEDFDYPNGDLLTAHEWLSHSGSGDQAIDITDGLSFTGHPGSGIRGAANLDNTGEDVYKSFTTQTTGVIYTSFLLKTSTPNSAGYFYMFAQNVAVSSFIGRIYINANGDGIGISNSSTSPTTFIGITPEQVYLVVVKYDFTTKFSHLYVFDSYPSAEPTAADQTSVATGSLNGGVGSVALRQYSASQRQIVDAIRVGTSWEDVVPVNNTFVSAPTFTPAPGTFTTSPISVAIACSTEGATIKYSTASATGPWSDYTAAISLTETTTIWTYAEKEGMTQSGVVYGEYIINTAATLTVSTNALSGFAYQVGNGPSNTKTFKVSGSNLTNNVEISCFDNGFEASLAGDNYANVVNLQPTNGTLEETTVYVRLKAGLTIGEYNESIMCSVGQGVGSSIQCSGVVKEVSKIVISQVYGGGGNSGATFKNDFIELSNRSTEEVTLTGAYIMYASPTGVFSGANTVALPEIVLMPSQYFLIQCAAGTATPLAPELPTADFVTTLALSGTNGKVALTYDNTAPTSSTYANVIDFVGYGSANMYEGSGAVSSLNNSTAAIRKNSGGQDTDDNSADFELHTPNPRNMAMSVTTISISDGDWSEANNWQPAIVPSLFNNVIVQNNMTISSNTANCNNLKIKSTGSVTINPTGMLLVSNTLTNENGNSGIIINSNSQSTGVLANNTENVSATINRYITGSANLEANKYHSVSIPLEVANPTSSLFMGCYLFEFNETTNEWMPLGSSTTTPLDNSKGYLIYYPNDNTTLPYEGILRTGDKTYNLDYTASDKGFNLIPNPYPTSIDWSSIEASQKVNMTDGFWIFSSNDGSYRVYNSSGGAGTTDNIIPLGQAIFVQANAEGAFLKFSNNNKYNAGSPILKSVARYETASKLHLRASANELADEIILLFDENWSNAQDVADMVTLSGIANAPQFSSIDSEKRNLTLNALPTITKDRIIPLAFSVANNTEAAISVKQIENFGNSKLYLVDKIVNKEIELTDQTSYSFYYNTSEGDNRFELKCKYNSLGGCKIDELNNILYYQQDDFIIIDIPNGNNINTNIQILNVKGQIVYSANTIQNGVLKIAAPKAPGVYVVNIVNTKESYTQKLVVK